MSKRKTVGEKVAADWSDLECQYADALIFLAQRIDRAIRRAQAEAWDECCDRMSLSQTDKELAIYSNPYRGRAKR